MIVHLFFVLIILCISIAAYLRQSLNGTGAVAAFVLGMALYISGGVTFLAPLGAFFVSSSFLTKYKTGDKKKIEKGLYEKTGVRDHVQVLANGGAALVAAGFYLFYPGEAVTAALFAGFAACNADTWASETGVLSKKPTRSILTFQPMERGISGGVTFLGTLGALGGALLLAAAYMGTRYGHVGTAALLINSLWICIAGFSGSILDSILGASLQPLYKNSLTGALTERRYQGDVPNIKLKGVAFFSNDMVNFISSGFAACMAYYLIMK